MMFIFPECLARLPLVSLILMNPAPMGPQGINHTTWTLFPLFLCHFKTQISFDQMNMMIHFLFDHLQSSSERQDPTYVHLLRNTCTHNYLPKFETALFAIVQFWHSIHKYNNTTSYLPNQNPVNLNECQLIQSTKQYLLVFGLYSF